MENIKVSVIIPVYNVEEYIEECVKSVVEQTLKEIEIIIVNDGTKDNSIQKIEKYLENPRVILINKKNEGVSMARNEGLKISRGEYILFLDSDDFIKKETLEECYNYAKKNDLDMVVFDINIYDDNLKKVIKIWRDSDFEENRVYVPKDYLVQYFCGNGCGSTCNKLWKKELYIKNKINYPKDVKNGEDASILPRLIVNTNNLGKINEAKLFYRRREGSATKFLTRITDIKKAYYKPLNYLKEKNIDYLFKYEFSYKWNHYYCNILNYKKNDNIIKENIDYKILYKELLKDLKNDNNKIFFYKDNFKNKLKNILFNKIYKKSLLIGELIRSLIIDIQRIKGKK